jgi:membrane-bound inhibitor of C-type lysozyme
MRGAESITTLTTSALLAACAAPAGPAGTESGIRLPAEHVVYRCVSGSTVDAAFTHDSAIVHYAGRTHRLGQAISASGARFVGDGLVWWTKGSGPGSHGWLYRADPDAAAGAPLEDCVWEGRS